MKTTLFLPVLNEIEGLRAVMPGVDRKWVDEILVVDGGSTDGSREFCEQQGYRVVDQTRPGITGAYQDAMDHIETGIVVAFSPDGNSLVEKIPELVAKMKEGYDMVIVSRYLDGARSADDDWVTAFGNWFFTAAINLVFRGHYTDSLVMFRGFRKDIVRPLVIAVPRAGFETILSIRCAKDKLRVTEIPGDEPKRIGGARKMDPIKNGLDILHTIWAERFG